MNDHLTIGTRGSALALWQANHVARALRAARADLTVDLQVIKTRGDRIQDVPLAHVGGKGLFVKEIEEAMLRGEVDLAVHSMKDLPGELVEGLVLAAISEREDPRDAIVSLAGELAALPERARIGTSSLRRRCQLLTLRPDLRVLDLRGNVDTRLRKLDEGQFDAVVLAAAGLRRLGHGSRATELLAPERMIPAVGQGALGIEARAADEELLALLRRTLHHDQTAAAVRSERAFLGRLGGGCQVPVAAHARLVGGEVTIEGLIGHPSGAPCYRDRIRGPAEGAERLGQQLAETLLARGGDVVLAEVYG